MALTQKYADDIDKHVGEKIRARRKQLRVSQDGLAASLGITFQQVQKYEKGVNRIAASRLAHLAFALDTPITWFFPPAYGGVEMPARRAAGERT